MEKNFSKPSAEIEAVFNEYDAGYSAQIMAEELEKRKQIPEATHIMGIDLGTTNSCVYVVTSEVADDDTESLKAVCCPTYIEENGERVAKATFPSVVLFRENGKVDVGYDALKDRGENDVLVYASKRFIGQKFTDPKTEEAAQRVSYDLSRSSSMMQNLQGASVQSEDVVALIHGREVTMEEIASYILTHAKKIARDTMGVPIAHAVITVPAMFDEVQREATRKAAKIAGLEVKKLVTEPSAAAYAFQNQQMENIEDGDLNKSTVNVVFDLGGGTFDISVVALTKDTDDDGYPLYGFNVIASKGDNQLGGEDFDHILIAYILDLAKQQPDYAVFNQSVLARCGKPLDGSWDYADLDDMQQMMLDETAKEAKIALSSQDCFDISLPLSPDFRLTGRLDRKEYENRCREIINKTIALTREAIKEASISNPLLNENNIGEIFLVGGQTKMPLISTMLEEVFGKKPCNDLDPDQVVAMGAAYLGESILSNRTDIRMTDVQNVTIGVQTSIVHLGIAEHNIFQPLVVRGTPLPFSNAKHPFESPENRRFRFVVENDRPRVPIAVFVGEARKTTECRKLLVGTFDVSAYIMASRKYEVLLRVSAEDGGAVEINAALYMQDNSGSFIPVIDPKTGNPVVSDPIVVRSHGLDEAEMQRLIDEAIQAAGKEETRRYQSEFLMAAFDVLSKYLPAMTLEFCQADTQKEANTMLNAAKEVVGNFVNGESAGFEDSIQLFKETVVKADELAAKVDTEYEQEIKRRTEQAKQSENKVVVTA